MISVCMAVYNGEKYVREQLESILPQLAENDEVIVSDDGSSDRTQEIIREMNDPRIHIFQNIGLHGYTRNFENALLHSEGDIIFISDQDDVWMNNKVRVMTDALRGYELVIHDAAVTDASLHVTCPSHFAKMNIRPGFLRDFVRMRYSGACMAFTRDFLELALPFPSDAELCPYDNWLAFLAEYRHTANVIFRQLILYRRHGDNALTAGEYSTRPVLTRIRSRLYCLRHVIARNLARSEKR